MTENAHVFPRAAAAMLSAGFLAANAFGFEAVTADPLAWLYADSKIASVERMDEIDVPENGVVDVNILLNGLKPGVKLEFEASEQGEWYRMVAVPVKRNTGLRGFLVKKPGGNPLRRRGLQAARHDGNARCGALAARRRDV